MSSGPTVLPSAFGSSATPLGGGGMQRSSERSNLGTSSRNGRLVSYHSHSGRAPLPYIKDLQDQAAHLDVDERSPISVLLSTAAQSIQKCQTLLDSDQVGQAYVQYLRASEIVVNLIPRHAEYRTLPSQNPNLYAQFSKLMQSIGQQQSTMDTIKQQIIEDNLAHSPPRKNLASSNNTVSSGGYVAYKPPNGVIRMPSPTDFQRGNTSQQENVQKINGTMSSPEDILAQRFARLRASQSPLPTNGSAITDQSASVSSRPSSGVVTDYPPRPSANSMPSTMSISSGPGSPRPLGPRAMGTSHYGPASPKRKPLDTANISLPKAPSPAYSPIWSVPSQPTQPNPPRKSTDSIQATNTRYSQLAGSRMNSPSRFGDDDNPYRSRTPNGVHLAQESKPTSADLPHNTTIRAQQLLEYMRRYNVLVIDVRPRELYDTGHIYARSIICIEPVVLKENVSAEELEERLIVSPEHEQSLFERRNEFDLVVYYDQNTDSVSYLAGSPVGTSAPHLRALYDTLYEFNAYKPLKDGRPPALLVGGLDAWEDLVGSQSLATSSTAAIMGSLQTKRTQQRPGRAFGRVPSASANSSLEIRKRRLREFTPLNHEELTAWMERAKNEEIKPGTYQGDEAGIPEEEIDENAVAEPSSPFVHTYEDFLRRFPEPQAIQQSMVVPEPRAPVSSTPNYASSIPVAPSRPPPAIPRPSYSGVSDGRQIQPTLARQNSATKTALYTSNSFMTRLKLPRTGLTNFGVTCYMNSTLQCLSSTVIMSKFFIDDRFRYYVQKNWKGSQGVMPGLYANLIRSLWKNDVEVIIPTSFRNFCGRLNREWAIDRQQDAKEFFDFVVDCLHEDLNINWQRTQLRPLTFEEEMQRERMPVPKVSKIEWDRYCHREESFISSLFAGQHASRLKCTTCKRTSTTYEAFYSISVEIPHTGTGDIYQCLQSYCQEEMLSGDEVWKCPYCKCERVATKQIIITRAPQILVIHLKRFSASKTQSARKIHTPVDFPLHGLRMDNFVIPYTPANSESGDQANDNGVSAAPPSLTPTTPPFTYDAYAVLRHLGSTLSGGHYISLVRDAQRQCWRRFDDERVSDFNPRDLRFSDRLQNEQAYILFYERVPAK
ncbi:ubiquitin C-terminal hydrolase, putative [Talaromyces stipitatus ATCC 10500]|uniref:Ubiquitin C-terminal hydrolase, putative n=1 Tax=Talaromyces stipitatus (strain ATCC 10500 / CBS 375.48 / QM 6759 / NRRL 1006) TaxID=441959 RepID=B8LYK4_TALSN|nr:ubiquitin C-terminal hydrolase, putative [Talaromyces stipitatus ATCC 10500]EED23362.1 ubiquitin C-terminal hydrolase, putative [Talaromyces stipitatus ATCC 10500]